jgi:hypothetical protein
MTAKTGVLILIVVAGLVGLAGYGCYSKGYSEGHTKGYSDADARHMAELFEDPHDANHSVVYLMTYRRGAADAGGKIRSEDFEKCSERLAQLAVEAGNAKVAGKWLAEGYFAPSQLKKADSDLRNKH